MKRAHHDLTAHEALKMQLDREELIQRIARALPDDGQHQPLEDLTFFRRALPSGPLHAIVQPRLCLIARGEKEVHLGNTRYTYDPFHFLLITAGLPLVAHVRRAAQDQPYLSLRLLLDANMVSAVMLEAGQSTNDAKDDERAIGVGPVQGNLLDAMLRLVRLADSPAQIPVLAPMIKREIVYLLLMSNQGSRLRHMAAFGGYSHRIARAIEQLQASFNQPVSIEKLAGDVGLSPSAFHHHFKAVTNLTPLQFQKKLRLHEARRLLVSEEIDAATAGFRVGYNDASHFSRDYKRLFGAPPMQDVEHLRSHQA